jgi:predicted TIM-barrel fold metal-dependent hydrolase
MAPAKEIKPDYGKEFTRREMLKFVAGAAALNLWQSQSSGMPLLHPRFLDSEGVVQVAERGPGLRPPLLVDSQTHVWWRAGGIGKMTDRGEAFLKALAGSRARIVGRPVPIADMGRLMWVEDIFLQSETDIAFLNSFGMKGAFDGVDLFPPREAAFIRSMAPARIRVLGTCDPPDGQSAVDSLSYQVETLKIDGLKLYPPGIDLRGWVMDDEQKTYPLFEACRKLGVKNICVHKGLPGNFLEEYCHPGDLVHAAADFPDLNFVAFHCAFPYDGELVEEVKKRKVNNVYVDTGTLAHKMLTDPHRYATLMGTLIKGLGAEHILWGTDTPVIGPPHWQIQAFQSFQIPEELAEKENYARLTRDVKNKIFGENAARLFNIDIAKARREIENELLYKLRADGNPLAQPVKPGVERN